MTEIHVGAEPEEVKTFAEFFDGVSATARRVQVYIDDTGAEPELIILPPEGKPIYWRFSLLREMPDQAGRDRLVLTRKDEALARMHLSDPEMRAILRARCDQLRRRPPVDNKTRLALWGLSAIASVALIIFVLVPVMADQLAEYLPPAGEQALGDATFEQIRSALNDTDMDVLPLCESPSGRAALDQMGDRLTARLDLPYPVRVDVLKFDLINAFALPGGRVVLFKGLIDAAETPDEVAAVFAHEIGHVIARDPSRIALRSAGSIGVLGLLFGDFAGGALVLFLTERMIAANYSRAAEAQADNFAHQALAEAGIPPSALARIFQRLADKASDAATFLAHFTSHPALGDRIAAATRADAQLTGALRPSLSDAEWQALKRICE